MSMILFSLPFSMRPFLSDSYIASIHSVPKMLVFPCLYSLVCLTLSPMVIDCLLIDCFLALCKLFPFDSIEATISIDVPFPICDCCWPGRTWDHRLGPEIDDLGPISGGTCPISVFLLVGWPKDGSTSSSADRVLANGPVLVMAFWEKRRKLFALDNTGAVSGFLESLLSKSIFCSLLKIKVIRACRMVDKL